MNMEGAMTKRQKQAKETKRRLYEAAIALIQAKGFNGINIKDITDLAGVSKGTFYTHFDSKEDLILYTFTQSDEFYEEAYEKVKDLDFSYAMVQFITLAYLENEKRGKEILKALAASYPAMDYESIYGNERGLIKYLRLLLKSGFEKGAIREDLDEDELLYMCLATLIGVETLWAFSSDEQKLSLRMEQQMSVLVRGMLKTDRII